MLDRHEKIVVESYNEIRSLGTSNFECSQCFFTYIGIQSEGSCKQVQLDEEPLLHARLDVVAGHI